MALTLQLPLMDLGDRFFYTKHISEQALDRQLGESWKCGHGIYKNELVGPPHLRDLVSNTNLPVVYI